MGTADSTIVRKDDIVSAISSTLKPGALRSLSAYMESHGSEDLESFGNLLKDVYLESGNIGDLSKYFTDGGLGVIEAIKGGNTNVRNDVLHEHSLWNDERSGEQTGEIQGTSEEVGSRRQNAEKLRSEGRTKQINITQDITCEVIDEDSYTDDMRQVADFLGKYGLTARFMIGEGVNTKKGVSFSGAVTGDNVAYIQYDSNGRNQGKSQNKRKDSFINK